MPVASTSPPPSRIWNMGMPDRRLHEAMLIQDDAHSFEEHHHQRDRRRRPEMRDQVRQRMAEPAQRRHDPRRDAVSRANPGPTACRHHARPR